MNSLSPGGERAGVRGDLFLKTLTLTLSLTGRGNYLELIYAVGRRTLARSLIKIPMSAISAIRRFSETITANYRSFAHAAFT